MEQRANDNSNSKQNNEGNAEMSKKKKTASK